MTESRVTGTLGLVIGRASRSPRVRRTLLLAMAVVATFACSSDDEPSDDTLFAILTDEEGNTEGLTGLA